MRIFFLCFCLVLTSQWAFAQDQTRVGHVNVGLVLEAMPEMAVADSLLRGYQDSLAAQFDTLSNQLQRRYNYLVENEADLTPKQSAEIQQELQLLQEELQVYQSEGARMFQLRRESYLTPILTGLREFVQTYAQENGYTLVLDSSLPNTLLYTTESTDLTEKIAASFTKN